MQGFGPPEQDALLPEDLEDGVAMFAISTEWRQSMTRINSPMAIPSYECYGRLYCIAFTTNIHLTIVNL